MNIMRFIIPKSLVQTLRTDQTVRQASEIMKYHRYTALPIIDEDGRYAVMLTYCSKHFEEDLPDRSETLTFEEEIAGRTVTVYCIDGEHTNPYRQWERAGKPEMTEALLRELREEGLLKPLAVFSATGRSSPLMLTPNSTFLMLVE